MSLRVVETRSEKPVSPGVATKLLRDRRRELDYRKEFVVEPGSKVHLASIDPSYSGRHPSHENAAPEIRNHLERIAKLQYLLYADAEQSLLVVLQALDAAGKDGVVRHLFSGLNPQGTSVYCFKQPSQLELGHDFLWRAHLRAPSRGELAIYNRSHYEDVLVVRVHDLAPESVWSKRYDTINDFEQMLARSICISALKSSSSASSAALMIRCAIGKSARPTTLSAICGPSTSRLTRLRSRSRAPNGPRGTSYRPTTNGFVISRFRKSSQTQWTRWDCICRRRVSSWPRSVASTTPPSCRSSGPPLPPRLRPLYQGRRFSKISTNWR